MLLITGANGKLGRLVVEEVSKPLCRTRKSR